MSSLLNCGLQYESLMHNPDEHCAAFSNTVTSREVPTASWTKEFDIRGSTKRLRQGHLNGFEHAEL